MVKYICFLKVQVKIHYWQKNSSSNQISETITCVLSLCLKAIYDDLYVDIKTFQMVSTGNEIMTIHKNIDNVYNDNSAIYIPHAMTKG